LIIAADADSAPWRARLVPLSEYVVDAGPQVIALLRDRRRGEECDLAED
jgi:hypothetical protein